MNKKYFYIVMSQLDLVENQVIEEIVRERTNYYISRKNPLDFWILMCPFFLLNEKLLKEIKKSNFYRLKRHEILYNEKFYNGVILSTSYEYINWLKLRLVYFENIDNNIIDDRFISNGLYGEINLDESSGNYFFETDKSNIHPKILISAYAECFETILSLP